MGHPKNKRNKARPQEFLKIQCICGAQEEGSQNKETLIQCDECQTWQHNVCIGTRTYIDKVPQSYQCPDCNPDAHQQLLKVLKLGQQPWKERIPVNKEKRDGGDILPLTDECHHYTHRKDVDWDIQKYGLRYTSNSQFRTDSLTGIGTRDTVSSPVTMRVST